jgi:energy-coupling factor transporter ATP-binding protein EcfA2
MKTSLVAWTPYLLGILITAALIVAIAFYSRLRRQKAHLELEMEKYKEDLEMRNAMQLENFKAEVAAQRAMKNDDRGVSRGPGEGIAESAPQQPDWVRVPEVPKDLAEACAHAQCVLFAGTGLDAQFGMADWSQTLAQVIEEASSQGLLEGADRLNQLLSRGDVETVESLLLSRLNRQVVLDLCRQVMKASRSVSSSPAHEAIQQLPFASVLTSSWNHWMDITFADRNPLTVTAGSPELQQALSGERFLVVRLFGDLSKEESIIYGAAEFRSQLEENETFRRLIASLVQTRMVFFVGISLKGIEEFMKAIRVATGSKYHYALVPHSVDSELQKELFELSYHTQLLLYVSDPDHTAVLQFLNSLRDQVGVKPQWSQVSALESGTISRITLQNIGPFFQVDLKLNSGWNVLLGNNGCGKSTILKAIALGLCGDEPVAARSAEQLLKAGEDNGAIEVELAGTVYRTRLKREPSGSVRVTTSQITPLQRGRWIALGFPPLRGISQRNPSGPLGGTRAKPDVDDLLPLLTGSVDHRLDDVKQWIVNLDVKSTPGPEISDADARRNQELRDSFFARLDSLCPGVDFKFDRVARDSWEVYVRTQDGAASIPVEQVSQGTTSFLGWIGTVLQRSYQIHTDIDEAESSPAVVLVDEIDAHLHPAWQKALVHLIADRFKNLQIITTTHSPLVVAGMKANEVFIVRRDPSDRSCVTISQAPIEFEGLRADQILTSPLFGLASSRSDETERDVDRYSRLLGIPDDQRTAGEQLEFESLRERLTSILAEGETEVERRVEKAVRSELRRAISPEDRTQDEPLGAEAELRLRSKLSEVFRAEEPIQRTEASQND